MQMSRIPTFELSSVPKTNLHFSTINYDDAGCYLYDAAMKSQFCSATFMAIMRAHLKH